MTTIKRFEDIEGWQKGRALAKDVYAVTGQPTFAKDYALRDQMRRAAVSVMSNIAEGFDRGGTAEFVHFLSIAKASAAEVRAQLYVALDQGYVTQLQFDTLAGLADDTARLIGGLMGYLRRSGIQGVKFK